VQVIDEIWGNMLWALHQHDPEARLGERPSIADAGIFPFIRQFSEVDKIWFAQSPYVSLLQWLNESVNSEQLDAAMKKYPPW